MERTTIRVTDAVGDRYCSTTADGRRLREVIAEALRAGEAVELSFERAEELTSAFLNASVGALYNGEFDDEQVDERVTVTDLAEGDEFIIAEVRKRAKWYYKDDDRRARIDEREREFRHAGV